MFYVVLLSVWKGGGGCASEALSLITLQSGFHVGESCLVWLADTASRRREREDEIQPWCSACTNQKKVKGDRPDGWSGHQGGQFRKWQRGA